MKFFVVALISLFSFHGLAGRCNGTVPIFSKPLSVEQFGELARLGHGGYLGSSFRDVTAYQKSSPSQAVISLLDQGFMDACKELGLTPAQCMAYADARTATWLEGQILEYLFIGADGKYRLRRERTDAEIRQFARDSFRRLYENEGLAAVFASTASSEVGEWQAILDLDADQRAILETQLMAQILGDIVNSFWTTCKKRLSTDQNFFDQIRQDRFPVRRWMLPVAAAAALFAETLDNNDPFTRYHLKLINGRVSIVPGE